MGKRALRFEFLKNKVLLILLMGVVLRVLIAILRSDAVWPDEQFQALEPASKIVFGRGILAWEWQEGYRSWTLPLLYVPILFLCKLLGFSGGLVPIHASRVFTVIFSGLSLWRLNEVLFLLRLRPWARLLTFAAFSFSAPMVLWGATTLADHWVMITSISFLPTCMRLSGQKSDRAWYLLGVLAGLPLLLKLQAGIFSFAIGLGFLIQRKTLRQLVLYASGVFSVVMSLGILDWVAYGQLFSALIQQLKRGEMTSRFYGVSPWFDYFSRFVDDQGVWIVIAMAIGFVTVLIRWRAARLFVSLRWERLWIAVAPGLLYFSFHICIPHKETRFLLPVIPIAYIFFGISLHLFPGVAFLSRLSQKYRLSPFLGYMSLGLSGVVAFAFAWATPLYLTTVNIAPLEAKVYELQNQSGGGSNCLLLMDHNWSWTRGQLILGDGMTVVERHVSEFSVDQDLACSYAILPESKLPEFSLKAASRAWSWVGRAPSGYVLMRKFQAY